MYVHLQCSRSHLNLNAFVAVSREFQKLLYSWGDCTCSNCSVGCKLLHIVCLLMQFLQINESTFKIFQGLRVSIILGLSHWRNLPVHGKFEINVVAGMLKKREELLKYSLCDVQTRYANLHIIYRLFKYIRTHGCT